MAPIHRTRRNVLKRITQTFISIGAGALLGGRQAYSTNNEAAFDITFSSKKIDSNAKLGQVAGKFSTNSGNGPHTYSLQRKIFGPSQFGVTSPFMTKNGDMVFTIYRRFPYGAATCDYAISDGTGVLGTDYAALDPLNGTLSFADLEIYKTVTIATMADGTVDKTVTCILGATSGSFIEDEHIGTGTIMEPTNGVYYFDATLGSDANGGSIYRPKKTWAALGRVLKNAGPGDAILFKRGETFTTNSSPRPRGTRGGGKNGNPVILGAYGDLSDPIPIIDKSGKQQHLRFINEVGCVQNITIQDIHFTSTYLPGNRPYRGLSLGNGNEIEIIDDYRIERCRINNLGSGAKFAKSINLQFRFNHVHDNFSIPPAETFHSSGLGSSHSDGLAIEYNLVERNGRVDSVFDWQLYASHSINSKTRWNIMRDGPNIDKFRGDDNYEVRGNIFTGGTVSGGGGGGDSSARGYSVSSNITYAQNYKHGRRMLLNIGEGSGSGSYAPGEMLDRMDVHSNIFHNEGDNAYLGLVTLGDNSSKNVQIYNNLCIANAVAFAFSLQKRDYVGISVRNNIIIRQSVTTADQSLVKTSTDALTKVDLRDNIYFNNGSAAIYKVWTTNYKTLAEFQAAYPNVEVGSIEADPMISDVDGYNYSLLSGSPAIGFGHPAPVGFFGSISSTDAGPTAFDIETSDRFYIDGDELKILYPLLEGKETIDVISRALPARLESKLCLRD